VLPQAGVPELESLLRSYSQTNLNTTSDLRVIEIIYFNMSNMPPSPSDIREWTRHFHLHERNILVLGAPAELVDEDAKSLIPGFQLLDRNLVLIADSTGSSPKADLYKGLLPRIPQLLRE